MTRHGTARYDMHHERQPEEAIRVMKEERERPALAQTRVHARMKKGGVTERRRGLRQERLNAKHDLASALIRLVSRDGATPVYIAELRRWAWALGYQLPTQPERSD